MEYIKKARLETKDDIAAFMRKGYSKPDETEKLIIDKNYYIVRVKFTDFQIIYIHIGKGSFNPDNHIRLMDNKYIFKVCIYERNKDNERPVKGEII